MTKSLYFSIFGGNIYESSQDEEKSLDSFQIPLKERPSTSCKKCHGRFYLHYNLTQKHYVICPKCAKKHIDFVKVLAKKKNETK